LKTDGPERCVLFQDILWQTSGKRILNVSIARPAKGQPYVAAITVPLGILLPAGLTLLVDEKDLVRFPLRFCNINGCRGQFPIT
jgi:invasion protein IalB